MQGNAKLYFKNARAWRGEAVERAQPMKWVLYNYEDPSSSLRNIVKKAGMEACTYNPSSEEAETGRCLELTGSSA